MRLYKKILSIIVFTISCLSLVGCSTLYSPLAQISVSPSTSSSETTTTCCVAGRSDLSCIPCRQSPEIPQPSFADPTTPFTPPTSTIIQQADVRTWPTFAFKSLGFSIKLPFSEESVHSQFVKCQSGNAYDEDGNDITGTDEARSCGQDTGTYYLFRSLVDKPWTYMDNTTFLSHVSYEHTFMFGWGGSHEGFWSFLSISDFKRNGHEYHYSFINDGTEIPNTPMVPIKIISKQGNKISIFNLGIIKRKATDDYGILIEQPNNKKFKAVALEFWETFTGTSKDQVEKIAESIIFK